LICIAGGVALSVAARGDVTPPAPVIPNVHAMHMNTNLLNRIRMMKNRHMNLPPALQQHSPPSLPPFNGPMAKVPGSGLPVTRIAHPGPFPVSAATSAAAAPGTADTASGNPYESIVTRNVFGLNPIPPPPPLQVQNGPPPPKITLTGIMTIFGPPEALFKVAGVVRGAGRPHDESYIFTEGEEQDEVEVTRIDTNKNIVSFMNHGVSQDIPLADGVASTGSAPSAPSWPGAPNGRFMRRTPDFNHLPPAIREMRERMQQQNGGGQNNNNSYSPNGFSGYNNANPTENGQTGLNADDQAVLIAAERAQAEADHNPVLQNILPPTPGLDGPARQAVNPSGGPPAPP
jgi:hypothetical protein